jgi:hypothetical protein
MTQVWHWDKEMELRLMTCEKLTLCTIVTEPVQHLTSILMLIQVNTKVIHLIYFSLETNDIHIILTFIRAIKLDDKFLILCLYNDYNLNIRT